MDKINSKSLLALLGGVLLMSFPFGAQAQWPTLDVVAIKTAVTSNLELVKQSKVVTDATALAGKINSGIGDAKASMSKYAGDNLEKAKAKMEKLKKEKERLDGMKEKYDKAKEFAEKRKAELEEAKAFANEQKARVAEAKAFVNEKKGEFDNYKNQAEGLKSDISSGINDAKGMAGDIKDVANAKKNELQEKAGVASEPEAEFDPEISSDDKLYEETPVDDAMLSEEEKVAIKEKEIAEAEEERDAALEYLEQVKAQGGDVTQAEAMLAAAESKLGKSYEEQALESAAAASENADVMPQDEFEYEKAARAAGSSGVSADFKAVGKVAPTVEENSETKVEKPQGRKAFGNVNKAAVKKANPAAKAEAKVIKQASPAVIKTGPVASQKEKKINSRKAFQKKTNLNLDKANKYVSRSFNEKMSFAQFGVGMIDNTIEGKIIGPESFFEYCGFSASDTTDKNVRDCLLKLVNATASDNHQDAAAAQSTIMEIQGEKNISFAAVGLKSSKDITGNDAKQDKLNTSAGQSSNARDDTSSLTMNNKETQVLVNGLMDVYSADLLLSSMNKLSAIKAADVVEGPMSAQANMVDDTFNGKKTVSSVMYELCEFNAKDVTETNTVIYDCMETLIKAKSHSDTKVAAEGSQNFSTITSNTALDKINEGFEALKDVAKNDSKVEKMEESSGDATNARMDYGALAATNLEIQMKLNKMLDVYSSQMLMDSLYYMKSLDISAFPEKDGGENG